MATIDTSTIEGFDAMSAEDKVNALLAYNYPDVDMSKYVTKETFDKKATEAAKLARDLTPAHQRGLFLSLTDETFTDVMILYYILM